MCVLLLQTAHKLMQGKCSILKTNALRRHFNLCRDLSRNTSKRHYHITHNAQVNRRVVI